MAGAGILAQPVVGLANIIRLINRLPNLAGKTVLSGSSNLFIPHLHGFSTGRTVNDAVEQIVKRTGIAFHNSWSTVNDFPYLLPFFRGYDCFMAICSCQVRNKKKLIFFINGEPLARFPMLLLYNFVFSLLLLIIPSSSLKVIKVPSDFNMLIIIHQHIINEISDYFFIKLIQLTKLC